MVDGGGEGTGVLALVAEADVGATGDVPDPRLLVQAQAALATAEDPAVRWTALHHLAYLGMRADPARFRPLVAALDDGDPTTVVDPAARVHGLLARAAAAALDGDLDTAATLAIEAHAVARAGGAGDVPLLRAAITVGTFGGDLTAHRGVAYEVLDDAADLVEEGGYDLLAPMVHAVRANAVWAGGDLAGAADGYRDARRVAHEVRLSRWVAEAECGLTHIHADRGDVAGARRHLEACIEAADRYRAEARAGRGIGGAGRQWVSTTFLRARIAFADGDDAGAVAAWRAEVLDPSVPMIARSVSAMDATVAALASGDETFVAEAAAELADAPAPGLPMRLVQPLVVGAAALDPDMIEQGVKAAHDAPFYGLGKATEIAGLVAARRGDQEQAASWLRTAHDTWRAAGADGLAARTASWLRDIGVHVRGPIRERPVSGWASLTEAERRVVEQVASGALYREIAGRLHLSRRTVETHVASSLRKLELRTRGELAAAWFADRPAEDP